MKYVPEHREEQTLTRVTQEKDAILALLKKNGFRITRQRKLILDIVFEHECTCCKEIYYEALMKDSSIGIATVYRMINTLTDLGVFQAAVPYRKLYQFASNEEMPDCDTRSFSADRGCRIVLENQKVVELTDKEWQQLLRKAVAAKGYADREIACVLLQQV